MIMNYNMESNNLKLAKAILKRYKDSDLLGNNSFIRDGSYGGREGTIEIYVIESVEPRKGAASAFLSELKAAKIPYDISWPMKKSIGFWRKMYERGLLPNPIESYQLFEEKFADFA